MLGTCNVVAVCTSKGKFFSDGHLISFILTLAVFVTVVDLGVAEPAFLEWRPMQIKLINYFNSKFANKMKKIVSYRIDI